MDKLTLFNRLTQIGWEFQEKAAAYHDFKIDSINQDSDFKMKIITSIVTVIVKNEEEDPYKYDSSNVFDYEYMRSLPSYSRYNPFVWMRLYSRKMRQLKRQNGEYRRYFRDLLKELKAIDTALRNMNPKKQVIDRIEFLQVTKDKIHYLLSSNTVKDLGNFIEQLQLAFFDNWKMSKNNFLSLLSLNRDLHYWDGPKNRTMQYIADLPEEIDYKTFEEAIFIHKLEHDRDCYLFDMYMDDMLRVIDQNKGMVFDALQEIAGPIPTYTVTTDEFGDITAVTPNKPNLKVVK